MYQKWVVFEEKHPIKLIIKELVSAKNVILYTFAAHLGNTTT